MSLRIHEWFGHSLDDQSLTAQVTRTSQECPFLRAPCTKRLKSGLVAGVCSVKPATSGPVICCPNRFYADDYAVLAAVALDAFGADARICRAGGDHRHDGNDVVVFGKRWNKEIRIPARTKTRRGSFFVDWVLARVDAQGALMEFVAMELQTMDTTGTYEPALNALIVGNLQPPASVAGINWENVNKRILPQLIYKGHVLRQEPLCRKGLYFVCPAPVYERVVERLGGNLPAYHPQPGTLTFLWYDLSDRMKPGEPRPLSAQGRFTTTVDQIALAFTSPRDLPLAGMYERAIREGLKAY